MKINACLSSKTEEWETPIYLFDELNREFNFTLDPCCSEDNHKCVKYYTKKENGLIQNWDGEIVFCNPPYGRQIKKWVKKAYESKCLTVLLIPARTDTAWFHDYILNKAEIRFIRGRLRFGGVDCNAPFPSMIVIYRNKY